MAQASEWKTSSIHFFAGGLSGMRREENYDYPFFFFFFLLFYVSFVAQCVFLCRRCGQVSSCTLGSGEDPISDAFQSVSEKLSIADFGAHLQGVIV